MIARALARVSKSGETMAEADKTTVLVADDEPSTLALVAGHLRTKAYRVIEASDGDDAWELACEHLPDLVVLDVMMPGMSGWEVCRKIRETVSLAHTAVVMLTGIGENLNEMTSPLYGADAYVDKPFEFSKLDQQIEAALKARASKRELTDISSGWDDDDVVSSLSDDDEAPVTTASADISSFEASREARDTAPAVPKLKLAEPPPKAKATTREKQPPKTTQEKAAKKAKASAKKVATKATASAKKVAKKATASAKKVAKKAAKKAKRTKAAKKAKTAKKAAKKVAKKAKRTAKKATNKARATVKKAKATAKKVAKKAKRTAKKARARARKK